MFTKEAYEIGCDARVREGYKRKVKLRETKTMLIGEDGRRYGKNNGFRMFVDWPMYRLDGETITVICNASDKPRQRKNDEQN